MKTPVQRSSSHPLRLLGLVLLLTTQVHADEYDTLRARMVDVNLAASLITTPVPAPVQAKLNSLVASVTSYPGSPPNVSGAGMWDLMNTNPSGRTYLWQDLKVGATDGQGNTIPGITRSQNMTASYKRLYTMATAYYTPQQALYHNSTLLADIISGLDWLNTNMYSASVNYVTDAEWYNYKIDTPRTLEKITSIMYDDLSSTQIQAYMDAVEKYTPDPYSQSSVPYTPVMTGSNLLDQAFVVAYRGIIVKDPTKIAAARDAISDVLPYSSPSAAPFTPARDGMYPDGSFIQHAAYPYIGGYGVIFLADVGQLFYTLDGSTWAVSDPARVNAYKWFFDAVAPFIYEGNVFDSVRGRTIAFGPSFGPKPSYPRLNGISMLSAIHYLSLTEPTSNSSLGSTYPVNPRLAMQGILKYWLSKDTNNQTLNASTLFQYFKLNDIVNDSGVTIATEPVGFFNFPVQDRAVLFRPGFAFGLGLTSSRLSNYESGWAPSTHGENLKGWYTGDGMTYLYTNDASSYYNFWQTVNPYRLPGTTVDTLVRSATGNWYNYISPNNWTGGTGTLDYGVIGMDFKAPGDLGQSTSGGSPAPIITPSNLVAKKSWFLFDDEIVALGAGITNSGQSGTGWDTNPRTNETVVEDKKLNAVGDNALMVNGAAQSTTLGWWAVLGNVHSIYLDGNTTGDASSVGYYFPDVTPGVGPTVKATRKAITGNYYNIQNDYPTELNVGVKADALVRPSDPNHGSDSTLYVKNDIGTYVRESYIKIDLSSYIQDTKVTFTTANLTITPTAVAGSNPQIHTAELVSDNSWTESGILYSNKPASTPLSPAQSWSGMTVGTPINIDITQALHDALNADSKIISLRIFATSGADSTSGVAYASRENPNFLYRPKVTLTSYREPTTANYASLWLDHGTNPTNASYAYAILPKRTSAQVQAYAANPDFVVLENSSDAQAVLEKGLVAVGANFWNDAVKTIQVNGQNFLTVDKKASVMTTEPSAGSLQVSIADPTQANTGSINVEINRSASGYVYKDTSITVTQTSPTIKFTVNVSGTYGDTQTVIFNTLSQTFSPSDDSYIADGTPTTNYGTSNILATKADAAGYNRKALLKFDLSGYPGPIKEAKSTLVPASSPVGSVTNEARPTTAPWSEGSVTWNTEPTTTAAIASWTVPAYGIPVTVDVTSLAQAAIVGSDKTVGLEILCTSYGSTTSIIYGSKENATTVLRPVLTVK